MVSALHRRIANWLEAHPVGVVLTSPADIILDPRALVQPDLFVLPLIEGRRRAPVPIAM